MGTRTAKNTRRDLPGPFPRVHRRYNVDVYILFFVSLLLLPLPNPFKFSGSTRLDLIAADHNINIIFYCFENV